MKKLMFRLLLVLIGPAVFYGCRKDAPAVYSSEVSASPDEAFYQAFNAAPVQFDGYELNEYHQAQNDVRRCRGQHLLDPAARKECVIPVVKIYMDKANKKIDDLKASLEMLAEKATDSTHKYEAIQKFYESRTKKIIMHQEALFELAD